MSSPEPASQDCSDTMSLPLDDYKSQLDDRTIMNDTFRHNNIGIQLLEMGQYENALVELKKAAHLLYSRTMQLQDRLLGEETSVQSQAVSKQRFIPTNNVFVQSTPILLNPPEYSSGTFTIESATVLINMALCYHLDSLRLNVMRDAMHNAFTLYEMAFSLAARCTKDSRSHQIILIALNNLGQLSFEMGNFEASKKFLHAASVHVTDLEARGSALMVLNCHEILLNAIVLGNPNFCAGAA